MSTLTAPGPSARHLVGPRAADRVAPSPRDGALRRAGTWSAANRVFGALTSLVVLRLAAGGLGPTELGLWLLLWACVPLFGFLDLGVSNAIVTRVAAARAAGRDDEARRTISSALAVLLLVAVATVAVGVVVLAVLDPVTLIRTSADGHGSLRGGAVVLCVGAGAGLPLGLAPRVLHACQRVDVASRLAALANLLQVGFAVVVAVTGLGFGWWVAVVLSQMLLTGALAWLVLLRSVLTKLRPSLRAASVAEARPLVRTGLLYAGLGLAGIVAFEIDAVVISAWLGADRIAAFAVPSRIFVMIPAVLQMAFLPLWPAIAEVLAGGDGPWARRAFLRATRWSGAAAFAAAGVVAVVIGPLMAIVAPGVERPDVGLLAVFVALAVVHAISVPYAAALSGADLVRPQVVAATVMAACNLALSVVLVRTIGIAGPPLATVLTQTMIVLVPLTAVIDRAWRSPPSVAT